jgi:tetratricopeptide (TPR) repeat protein
MYSFGFGIERLMLRVLKYCGQALIVTLCLSVVGLSQAEGIDGLYAQARELAFNGKRQAARDICTSILEKNPNYHDARLLLGRLYLWDWKYELARAELTQVLTLKPAYADARDALIDVELWSDHPEAALPLCEEGIHLDPSYKIFYYKKAKAL